MYIPILQYDNMWGNIYYTYIPTRFVA